MTTHPPLSWYLDGSTRTTRRRVGWIIAHLRDVGDLEGGNVSGALRRQLVDAGVPADELDGARFPAALEAAASAELVDREINGKRTVAIRLTDDGRDVDLENLAWPMNRDVDRDPATSAPEEAGGGVVADTAAAPTVQLEQLATNDRQVALQAAATVYTGCGGIARHALLRLASDLETWLTRDDRTDT